MSKFGALNKHKEEIPFEYSNLFYQEPLNGGERITIGPSSNHVSLILDLAEQWEQQEYYVLYVLLISHAGYQPGRYQSPILTSFADLKLFLSTFQGFLESDGRHHIWVVSSQSNEMLIYDQHNVIFAYGDLEKDKKYLVNQGFQEQSFRFPVPHVHSYLPENAKYEDELMGFFDWQYFSLEDGDEY